MSIYNLQTLSNIDLRKLVNENMSLDDINNECDDCGRPVLLHLNPSEPCTRKVDESQEVVAINWNELQRRLKPILKDIKEVRMKEKEQNVYLDGIKQLVQEIRMEIKTH